MCIKHNSALNQLPQSNPSVYALHMLQKKASARKFVMSKFGIFNSYIYSSIAMYVLRLSFLATNGIKDFSPCIQERLFPPPIWRCSRTAITVIFT